MGLIPFDKWRRMFKIIRDNGGVWKSSYKYWRFDTLKEGQYVGCDANGNKYYKNDNYIIGRNRWVEHHIKYRWDYDATHITSEWFGWLHYKTDKLPSEDAAKHELLCSSAAQSWLLPFEENLTGTDAAYYPYSTTTPKVHVWDGRTVCSRD
ncbi:hypothetical protein PYW07_000171 [Mythimna separata]|uniref:NADH dehydrogenase [ubiquinone] 1 alpha subcomplex subunit 12 n=1 Tax=Mythimna separata TaxID=271217 RepID=A0AAD8E1L4_MYTSE|nr:hypothetical protein PYW07_000171 [Mythimna separata]